MRIATIYSLKDLDSYLRNDAILCLFSGGVDSTYLLHILHSMGFNKVIALTVDIGQEIDDSFIEGNVKKFGYRWIKLDKKIEFVNRYVFPSIVAHADYLGGHPISASLSRPLIVKEAIDLSSEHNVKLILHTANSSQNSLRRFNNSLSILQYRGNYGSPFVMNPVLRSEKLAALLKRGVSFDSRPKCSVDENIWVREFEYGSIDSLERMKIHEKYYLWSKPTSVNDQLELVISLRNGVPFLSENDDQTIVDYICFLNKNVGSYGHGRYIWLEEISHGRKVQEAREAPAATILFDAYRRLESACLSSEEIRVKRNIEQVWVREASEGRWFGDLKNASQAFIESLSSKVNGSIRYIINSKSITPISMKPEKSLCISNREIYEKNYASGER